jgi:putative ABC transport system permease protein
MTTSGLGRPSFRKIIADLAGNWARTALVVASITVGVFAVGMIAGAYAIIPAEMTSSFAGANPANIQILTLPFDHELLDALARLPGIQSAQAERAVSVRWQTSPGLWTSLDLVARSSYAPDRVDQQLPLAGATVPGKKQVILEKRTAEKYHLAVGSLLDIQLADGTARQLEVTGVGQDLTSGIGGMFNSSRGYILEDTLEWLHEPDQYNKLLLTVSGAPNDPAYIQQTADRVTAQLKRADFEVFTIEQNPSNKHPMKSILEAILGILLFLGVLIVFLSGSLISNTLAALLNQHLQQIGIMKLVGASRIQIVRMYLALILAYGLLSLLIALPLGSWAAYALSAFAGSLIGFPIGGFRIVPQAVIFQALIALVVPLLAGSLPVLGGARVTVRAAIAGPGAASDSSRATAADGTPKKDWVDRTLGSLRGVSRPLLVSIRNTFRRKGRLALTLLTLTLGGAIFISVFNVQVSLNTRIDQITQYFGADVNLDFSRPYTQAQVENVARGVSGVNYLEPWIMTQADLLRADDSVLTTTALLAPPAGSPFVTPVLMSGRWIQPGDQGVVTINEAFRRKVPGIQVGDILHMKVGGRRSDWQVVGIFQFTGVDELIAYANQTDLAHLLNLSGRTATFRIGSSDHSLAAQTNLAAALDQAFRDRNFQVSLVEAGGSRNKSITEYIGILTAFLVIMAMLTAAVGSIGMAGTLSMNVMERTREIGVLRAIGAYDTLILNLVLVEGLLIGAISYIVGALLSFPITLVLSDVISRAIFDAPAKFAFTLQGFGIWLAVVLVLSVLASLVPARSASRMTIREVLAYE